LPDRYDQGSTIRAPREGLRVAFVVEAGLTAADPVLRVTGDLDELTARELAGAVHDRVSAPHSVTIDLTETTFLNSSGARQLMVTSRELARSGVPLRVLCPRNNRAVWRIVDILELQSVVPIAAPEEDGGDPT
jgi:anti-sigma B factor antagonist